MFHHLKTRLANRRDAMARRDAAHECRRHIMRAHGLMRLGCPYSARKALRLALSISNAAKLDNRSELFVALNKVAAVQNA